METDIITKSTSAALPARTQTLIADWRTSPRKSFDNLPDVVSHKEIFDSPSPTLAQIKNHIGEPQAVMIISMAIEDVNLLYRKDRRMEEREIVLVAKRILKQFWYFKPEDLKKCFYSRRPKQFVLEGDSFLSWLSEYDLSRDNACEDDAMNGRAMEKDPDAISLSVYMEMLRAKAESGDEESQTKLKAIEARMSIKPSPTQEELRQKEIEFKLFKHRQSLQNNNHK